MSRGDRGCHITTMDLVQPRPTTEVHLDGGRTGCRVVGAVEDTGLLRSTGTPRSRFPRSGSVAPCHPSCPELQGIGNLLRGGERSDLWNSYRWVTRAEVIGEVPTVLFTHSPLYFVRVGLRSVLIHEFLPWTPKTMRQHR